MHSQTRCEPRLTLPDWPGSTQVVARLDGLLMIRQGSGEVTREGTASSARRNITTFARSLRNSAHARRLLSTAQPRSHARRGILRVPSFGRWPCSRSSHFLQHGLLLTVHLCGPESATGMRPSVHALSHRLRKALFAIGWVLNPVWGRMMVRLAG